MRQLVAMAALVLIACTTGTHDVGTIYSASKIIGPEGGTITVTAADDATIAGTSIVVPPGAVSKPTEMAIRAIRSRRPTGISIIFEPLGLQLAVAATARIPVQGVASPTVTSNQVSVAYPDSTSETINGRATNGFVTFQVARLGSCTSALTSEATLESLTVGPTDPVLPVGLTIQLTATGTFSDGSTITDLQDSVTWIVSDPTVASVDATGLLTALRVGTTTITGSIGFISAPSIQVVVMREQLVSIALAPASPVVVQGTSLQITATGTYTDNSTRDLTNTVSWHSSDPTIATINSTGKAIATGLGTTTISANLGVIVDSTDLTVIDASPTGVTINAASYSAAAGQSIAFAATGQYDNGATADVTSSVIWASGDDTIATVDATGSVQCLRSGTVAISAYLGCFFDSKNVTCGPPILVGLELTSPYSGTVAAGTTVQLTLTGTYSDGSTADLTNDPAVAYESTWPSIASVVLGGLVTTHQAGTATIVARRFDDTAEVNSATITIYVGSPVPVSVTITQTDGSNHSLPAGTAEQFAVTSTYTDGSMVDLTYTCIWTSSDVAVATVDATGVVRTYAAGSAVITCQYGDATASYTLTVGPPEVISIDTGGGDLVCPKGSTIQLTATATFTDGSTVDITSAAPWSSSNPSIATVSNGLVRCLDTGSVSITVFLTSVTHTRTIRVGSSVPAVITVNSSNATCPKGTTIQLTATVTLTDGTLFTLTTGPTWTTSNSAVATVSGSGLVVCKSQGAVTISATSDGVTGSTIVTVGPPVAVAIGVTPAQLTIPLGMTAQLTATMTYSDGTTSNVTTASTWSSSDEAFATVSGGFVQCYSVGAARMWANYVTIASLPVTITCTPPVLVSLEISPFNPEVTVPGGVQLAATGTYSDLTTRDVTGLVAWTTSDASVATVDSVGSLRSVAAGTVTITASMGSVSSSTNVTIIDSPPTILVVRDDGSTSNTVPLGQALGLIAIATYSGEVTLDVTSYCIWSSSDSRVASADQYGQVNAFAQGVVTITCNLESSSGTYQLTVGPPELVSLSLGNGGLSRPKGTTVQLTATGNYTDGDTANLTSAASWSSSDNAIATVSSGLVKCNAQGVANITATSGSISGTRTINCTAPVPVSLAISPSSPSCMPGWTIELTAKATMSDGTVVDWTSSATWASNNASTVNLIAKGEALCLASGTATITVTYMGLTGSAVVRVAGPIVSVNVTPSQAEVPLGLTEQLTASTDGNDGTVMDVTSDATWSSSDTSIAVVSQGLVSCLTVGTAEITATYNGIASSPVTITCTPPVLIYLTINPAHPQVLLPNDLQLTATGNYSDGGTVDLTEQVMWSTSNADVATVGNDQPPGTPSNCTLDWGCVQSVSMGTVTIAATFGDVTASVPIEVSAP